MNNMIQTPGFLIFFSYSQPHHPSGNGAWACVWEFPWFAETTGDLIVCWICFLSFPANPSHLFPRPSLSPPFPSLEWPNDAWSGPSRHVAQDCCQVPSLAVSPAPGLVKGRAHKCGRSYGCLKSPEDAGRMGRPFLLHGLQNAHRKKKKDTIIKN